MTPTFLQRMDEALAGAIGFLARHQLASGEFQSFMSADPEMVRDCVPDSSPFPTALIAYSLSDASGPAVPDMMRKALDFLEREMEWPGLWRYWTAAHPRHHHIPPDLDDMACASYALREFRGRRPRNRGIMMANRNTEGLFYTWVIPRGTVRVHPLYQYAVRREARKPPYLDAFFGMNECKPDDIDCVVNANVLLYLGESSRTQKVIDYLIRTVRDGKEACCDKWHLNRYTFYYMVSRNYLHGVKRLGAVRGEVLTRLSAQVAADGGFGTPLDTALAICSMLNLEADPPELTGAIEYLLGTQMPTGGWRRSVMYYGGPQKAFGWGSEEMTTGFCIEALRRYGSR